MKLHELLADDAAMASIRRRACGDAGVPMGPPVSLPPITDRWPQQQRRNTGAATEARKSSTTGVVGNARK